MTSEAKLWESKILSALRQSSEDKGLRFYEQPSPDVLPEFLGDYRPDAMLLAPDGGGVVVEIKQKRSPASDLRISEIAKKFLNHKGWEFRVIYRNPLIEATPPILPPSAPQIQALLDELDALVKGDHQAAALILGWAALEALARVVVPQVTGSTSRFTPLQAVQTLAENGYLESDVADRFRSSASLRNSVAHGDLSIEVSPDEVRWIVAELRKISRNIEAANMESPCP